MQAEREKSGRLWMMVRAMVAAIASGAIMPGAGAASLTDGAGRAVTVPPGVMRVVPAGPPAQVLLHVLAPRMLAGLVEPFARAHAAYVDPRIAALPQIPMLSRSESPADIATVSALKPDLCVDYGQVSPRFVASIDKTGQALHVPALIFGGDLKESAAVVTRLGAVLGQETRAADLSSAVRGVLDDVKPVSDLPDAEKVAVYVARGPDGLQALRAGSSFDEPIDLAGGRNVVRGGGGPFKHMEVADVVALKPAVVIVGQTEALSSALHDALPKGTIFVLDAGEPYKVLVGPPSLNRIIGLAALAPILHPDRIKADDAARRLETRLFPTPAGVTVPAPLQVRE